MTTWQERFQGALGASMPNMADGDASAFDLSIDRVNLIGGGHVNMLASGVTAIVGANNAGKSTLLREIYETLSHQPGFPTSSRLAVGTLELNKAGTPKDVIAWLGENANFVVEPNTAGFQRPQTTLQHPSLLTSAWQSGGGELGFLAPFVSFYGNAQARFGIGGSAGMRESVTDPAQHPVHYLQDSRPLLDELSKVTEEIFGSPLTLDTLASVIRLRVGRLNQEAPRIDDIPADYREAMAALRPLDEQGDGMRSLLGQLLPIVTAGHKIVIVDEPEAFLHPPQAQALGSELGRLAALSGVQVVLATHDRNLLAGLLISGAAVSVVRLTRSDSHASASQLDSSQLRELWNDPVLRYTNVLDGLFHRLVVLAEAEGDCAFLAAGLDSPGRESNALPANEVLFVPTGGKDGMPKVAAALTALNVPTVAAPDLDVISDKGKLKTLIKSLGSDWTPEIDALWNRATNDIRQSREPAKVGDVLDAVRAALEEWKEEPYSSDYRDKVHAQLRTSGSPWGLVKEYGVSAFKGQSRVDLEALLVSLDQLGIVCVREGELERLAPTIAERKGPGWLQAALSAGAQLDQATQAHLDRILAAGMRGE